MEVLAEMPSISTGRHRPLEYRPRLCYLPPLTTPDGTTPPLLKLLRIEVSESVCQSTRDEDVMRNMRTQ